MSGENNLDVLVANMSATLVGETFVFVALTDREVAYALDPVMIFEESEGTTAIAPLSRVAELGLAYEFRCRMITLNIHSALEAVGFIALISSRLAAAGMGVNPVAGYYHDHLFVPEGRETEALEILNEMAAQAGKKLGVRQNR